MTNNNNTNNKQQVTNKTEQLKYTDDETRYKLEKYLQFSKVPRFQNHQNKILITHNNNKNTITIQRPLERLNKREKETLLINKECKIIELADGLTYEKIILELTNNELNTLLTSI